MQNRYQFRKNQVAMERIEGELIIISMDSGKYFSASGPAADILFLIDAGKNLIEIQQELETLFNNKIDKSEIETIIEFSLKENLLELLTDDIAHSKSELPEDYMRTTWVTPNIVEFSDLQDLILVDPVHDASLKGWPVENPSE